MHPAPCPPLHPAHKGEPSAGDRPLWPASSPLPAAELTTMRHRPPEEVHAHRPGRTPCLDEPQSILRQLQQKIRPITERQMQTFCQHGRGFRQAGERVPSPPVARQLQPQFVDAFIVPFVRHAFIHGLLGIIPMQPGHDALAGLQILLEKLIVCLLLDIEAELAQADSNETNATTAISFSWNAPFDRRLKKPSSGIFYAVGYMSCGNDSRGKITVAALVIKKDVRTEAFEKGGFILARQKDSPRPYECPSDAVF